MGKCVIMTNGKPMAEVNGHEPTTPFGIWLKGVVDKKMEEIRKELE